MVYFIFNIKDEFVNLYKDNERILFSILKGIYYLDNHEVKYGYNLLNQLINKINKSDLDRHLFLKLHGNIPYSKRDNVHIYNNLYKDEVSRLTVKECYIKLETEQKNSTFFNLLKKYNNNYFICEFRYQDYFFLDKKMVTMTI